MKQLETQFTQNDNVFTQVKRNDKAALYKRTNLEGGFVSYEVFAIKTKAEAEVYPNQTAMSRWAWCPVAEDRANLWFDRLTNGDVVIPEVDPETGEPLEAADNRSLDELPDVIVSTDTVQTQPVVVANDDPTAPDVDVPVVEIPTVDVTPDGGAVVTVAKVVKNKVLPTYKFPNTAEWLRDDFAELNGMDHHPAHSDSYGPLAALVKAGKVVEVKKAKVGKGRPRSFYSVVTQPTTV